MAKTATKDAKKAAPTTGDPALDKKVEDLVKFYSERSERSIRESFEKSMEDDVEETVKERLKRLKLDEDAIKKAAETAGKLSEAEKKLSEAERKFGEAEKKLSEAEKKDAAAAAALEEAKRLNTETAELLKKISDRSAAAPAGDVSATGGGATGRPGVLDYLAAMTDEEKKKFFAVADTLDEKAEQSSKLSRLFR